MQLNLKSFFDRVGIYFKAQLEKGIENQVGIDGKPFSRVEISTAKSRTYANNAKRVKLKGTGARLPRKRSFSKTAKGMLGSFSSIDFRRLFFTGRFRANAFKSEGKVDHARVYINPSYYSMADKSLISYPEIVAYNNRGSGATNPDIKNPPLIFPNRRDEIVLMKQAVRASIQDWNSKTTQNEILDQITKGIAKKTVVEIRV